MTLEERLIKAKIPCEESGITIKKTLCDICTPTSHCGINAYVKDGKIIKVEGDKSHPGGGLGGSLCARGASSKDYVYRKNRVKTPLRRVGPRGSGQFEVISWDEAYKTIAENLDRIKREHGADSVAWYSGHSKWYREWMMRLANSFGSVNYGTESSVCFESASVAWKTMVGEKCNMDFMNAKVFWCWTGNPCIGVPQLARGLEVFKQNGGKVVIVDIRETVTVRRFADIFLKIRPGTDGALAMCVANLIIQNGWQDQEYIDKYVHGFEEYKENVKQFTLEYTEKLTGAPASLIFEAAKLYATSGRASAMFSASAMGEHTNGYNSMRACIANQALLGNIDRPGGDLPYDFNFGFSTSGVEIMDREFVEEKAPPQFAHQRIGAQRFPAWDAFIPEFQAMDLFRQIDEGTPYPIKALVNFGMNTRMFPDSDRFVKSWDKLDFVVSLEIVMNESCEYADIVLPVCTSFERSEIKGYGGGYLTCTAPVIEPLYQSKPDTVVICELAKYLDIDDDLLKSGYENTMRHLVRNLPVTLDELRDAPLPLKIEGAHMQPPGEYLKHGFPTPTGKIELYSTVIEKLMPQNAAYTPMPVYTSPYPVELEESFPFTLITGTRVPFMHHSRMHDVESARSLRREPICEISLEDANRLGLGEGDLLRLYNGIGSVSVKAHPTATVSPGCAFMFHGYREANVNTLLDADYLDPYTGYPSYRLIRCRMEKAGE